VFDQTATYHKSAKGAEAIATRSAALGPKLRSMLILIDGKRATGDLAKLGQMLGDPLQLMAQLAEQGYIEPVGGASASSGAATVPSPLSSNPVPLAPAHRTVPLADAQRYAVRQLTDLLGPTAESLCLRIEGTKNAQEFMAVMHKAEGVLRQFGGAQLAARFTAAMESHRPA
jgi:hypothetical protein